MFTWAFSLETVARVAAWAIITGFFWSLGCAIFGIIPRGRKQP